MRNEEISATPAAKWRELGKDDPFHRRYDCERAALCLGHLTDDALANALFLHDHKTLNVASVLQGEPSSIALLTAAKERIRWLSRLVVQQAKELEGVAMWHNPKERMPCIDDADDLGMIWLIDKPTSQPRQEHFELVDYQDGLWHSKPKTRAPKPPAVPEIEVRE